MDFIAILDNVFTHSGTSDLGSRTHDSGPIKKMSVCNNVFINDLSNTFNGIHYLYCTDLTLYNNSFSNYKGIDAEAGYILGHDIVSSNNIFLNNRVDMSISADSGYDVSFLSTNDTFSSIRVNIGNISFLNPALNYFTLLPYETANIIIKYTNGKVFVIKILDTAGTYIIDTPSYYFTNSRGAVISTSYEGSLFSITTYPITLQPTVENEYLTVSSVSENPDTITVESTVGTNPTAIGYTNMNYSNSNVILVVDGVDYDTSLANDSGTVFHNYNGDWTGGHTFTWKKESSYVNESIINPESKISYSLSINYPNPFRSSTEIMYSLPVGGNVNLVIYNILGQKVRTLVNGHRNSGYYRILWDGKDANNQSVSNGIYFYRLTAGNYKAEKKMILIR